MIMASMRKAQSQNPVTPPGATATYINVVQGKNINPRMGQRAELKATPTQAKGRAIHQITPAIRGPRKSKTVKKQHIGKSLLKEKAGQVRDV
jgi:hypothetical protein